MCIISTETENFTNVSIHHDLISDQLGSKPARSTLQQKILYTYMYMQGGICNWRFF